MIPKASPASQEMSLLGICDCDGRCCVGRTVANQSERARIRKAAGVDHFSSWNTTLSYLERGTCKYLLAGRCSVQHVKPFVCQIYPLVPRVVNGELWLFLVGECPAAIALDEDFIERAVRMSQAFFSEVRFDDYARYWNENKIGDFDDSKVVRRIRVPGIGVG